MTSKERVIATYQHKPVDKIPTGFSSSNKVHKELMEYYGISTQKEFVEKLDLDIVYVQPPFIGRELKTYTDEKGNKVKETFWGSEVTFHNTGKDIYPIDSYFPISLDSPLDEIANFKFPNPDEFDYSVIKKCIEEYPDKGIMIGHPGPFQVATSIIDMADLFILMAEEPEVAKSFLDHLVDFEVEFYTRAFEAGEGKVDIVRTCDDYGTQISLLFSVDMWKEFFQENTKRLVDLAHKYNVFYHQHSCGAIAPLIPELIKCGVDALEPIQKVVGLEVEKLSELYDGQICFHGGIDTQHLMPNGTVEDVQNEVAKFIKYLGKNGGYVLMGSQGYESDIPIENVVALYEAPRNPPV